MTNTAPDTPDDELVHAGVIVIELDDVIPRRHPGKPNLYVARTDSAIVERYGALQSSKRQRWFKGHEVALRTDLSIEARPMTVKDARNLEKATAQQLKSAGYTVNRDPRVWTVYVIELDAVAMNLPGRDVVYVGETSRTPEDRYQQHITRARGKKGNKLYSSTVAKHFVRLRMDLAPGERLFDAASSKRAEAEWRDHLCSLGYVVKGGH